MCRTTEFPGLDFLAQEKQRRSLKIKSFSVRLTGLVTEDQSLTLVYLPGFGGSSTVKRGSAAYVTLHRAVNVEREGGGGGGGGGKGVLVFESRERVRVGEGVRFEVYLGGERVLEGGLRKGEEWELGCKCGLEGETGRVDTAVAEVCLAVEGKAVALRERVELRRRKRKTGGRRRCSRRVDQLEVILEEREEEGGGGEEGSSDGGACCCCCEGGGSGGGELELVGGGPDLDGVSWAIDVGVWVMCLGVGYMVSKASAKSLRRLRLL
ncbi:hypothetical protein Tsubulata_005928 [Turnera subulata]|uniref:Uncharacterized protein n=1 Tax=Turnera subulata TaxID=218843 RepID=A0A9Q0G9Z0_9ROSI|nr:hypothetical protein Tsubulata_005928 [Turnera subulata]